MMKLIPNTTTAPTVTAWPTAKAINYGQKLANSSLGGGSAPVPGTFAFTAPLTVPGVGTASQSVTFTPTDTTDYTSVSGTVNVTVNAGVSFTLTVCNANSTGGTVSSNVGGINCGTICVLR